ncbi:MAG: TolC family protein [Flavobacteriales bacterium]|jgi:outer membrane protein|tara:strand:- start:194 stop:1501 length:1308 start_codon:yes stop_codon:yes gene_type:complete
MKLVSILALIFSFSSLHAQQIWSLEDCIAHALTNNISLKQAELNIDIKESLHLQSKLQFLPSINASNSFNQNKGLVENPLTNIRSTTETSILNLSYSTNFTLFSGFKNVNQLKKAATEVLRSTYDLETAKNDLISSIALSYLQILFNHELYSTSEKQLLLTQTQETRINTLVDAGSLARGELLNIQSQLALEEQQLVQAENQLTLSKLQLAQLLDLENYRNLNLLKLDLEVVDFEIQENIDLDFEKALSTQSSIKSAELEIESAQYDLKIAQSSHMPTLSWATSINTFYVKEAEDMFKEQLTNNQRSSQIISLNIPIFNKWATRTSIKQSKIQIENSLLNTQQAKNKLRKNMEQGYTDQIAAYKKHNAAKKAILAYKESFTYINTRYTLGMVNSYEFNEAKNQLIKAESDALQAKYDLIFKVKLYEFYTSLKFEL